MVIALGNVLFTNLVILLTSDCIYQTIVSEFVVCTLIPTTLTLVSTLQVNMKYDSKYEI